MSDYARRYRDGLLQLVHTHAEIKCVALVGAKIVIGVPYGEEASVCEKLKPILSRAGIEYEVAWEVSVSKYPELLIRDRQWVAKEE